ncbi:Oidioi.mRNA.OKI2018_I69.XSR.g13710.t1.cds [Oikopleura dioica]|uniref:Oidioi.mRNA.OKI2018_I69.XSR.g13710.t1.cds n=1 Tax=Oikopleura dioica TaxID=34765 RepID=A0ABN7SCE2_OIKDI|nr:Oidioi.mRNA.OKI2018_I69.XSR.g13710.t1.cds [Oikopleura dioica]
MLKFLKEKEELTEFNQSWFNDFDKETVAIDSKQKTVRFTCTEPEVIDKATFTTAEKAIDTGISSPPTPACGQSLLSHTEPATSPQLPPKQPERLAQLPYPYKSAEKNEEDTDYLSEFTNLKFANLPGEDPKKEEPEEKVETSPDKEEALKKQIRHLQDELGTIKGYISEKMQKQTEARQILQSEIAELIRHSEKVQTENTTYRQLLGIDSRYKSL